MTDKTRKRKDVFNNAEYLTIKRNNRQLLYLDEKEVNGLSKTDLAKLIGEKLGEGVYHYTVKYYADPKITVGKITSIMKPGIQPQPIQDKGLVIFENRINQLENLIKNQASGNSDLQAIMQMKDSAYAIQIDFWKSQAEMYKNEIERLKKQLDDAGGGNNLTELIIPLLAQLLTGKPAAQ
ncbi:MAG: hypothetical protein AB1432_11605 [Bacteroidota bacterium]|jgi:hypothetical protein